MFKINKELIIWVTLLCSAALHLSEFPQKYHLPVVKIPINHGLPKVISKSYFRVRMLNTSFNNISVILWQSV
jgi:hypothetical protein